MKIDDAQKQKISAWIAEGAKLADIQKRIQSEFGLAMTYMEVRLLVSWPSTRRGLRRGGFVGPRAWLAGLALLPLVAGCGTVGYYAQAIHGQYQILHRKKPIEKLLADPKTPTQLKERLTLAL